MFCLVPLCLTAIGCVVLFFYADDVYRLLEPLAAPVGRLAAVPIDKLMAGP